MNALVAFHLPPLGEVVFLGKLFQVGVIDLDIGCGVRVLCQWERNSRCIRHTLEVAVEDDIVVGLGANVFQNLLFW